MSPLITPAELKSLIDGDHPLTILDVRWRLDQPDGRAEYRAAHIPGAVYVDLGRELAEPGRPAAEGRHPLPSAERLQAAARRWGLQAGDAVVVYDDIGTMACARAWWLLTHAGVENVRVLDGALRGWREAGYALDSGEHTPQPSAIELSYSGPAPLTLDDAADFPKRGTLVDVRAAERYRGDEEPIDPRAGHIPGAINIPAAGSLDESGRFLPAAELRRRLLSQGVDPQRPVAAYCGSGVNAAHAVLALKLAGVDAALYPGSFSEWANHGERPVALGDQPR